MAWTVSGLAAVLLALACTGGSGHSDHRQPTGSALPAGVSQPATPLPACTISSTTTSTTTSTTAPAPPTTLPPITPAQPGPTTVIAAGPGTSPGIALTFDDGYCDGCVGTLVSAIARTRAHVTVCPNGRYASVWEHYAAFIKVEIAQGLVQICNHTLDHKTFTTLSDDQIRYEIQADEDWIERTFGVSSRPYLRPPGGTYNRRVLDIAGQLGFTAVLYWSATLSDSSPQPPEQAIGATQRCARPGVTVLGHSNYPTTAEHFDEILAAVSAKGLKTLTVAEVLGPQPALGAVAPDPVGACV